MNGNNLSINVVHTPGYGYALTDNATLVEQLNYIADNYPVDVNVLINGNSTDNKDLCLSSVIQINQLDKRLKLGLARYELSKMTTTKWYMQIDEDDEFFSVDSWLPTLLKDLPEIGTATAFYRFQRYSDKEIFPNQFDHALYLARKKKVVDCFTDLFPSSGTLYNKELLGDFPRPNINFAEDNLTFFYLCRHHHFTTYVPLLITNYRDDHSVMSKVDDDDPYSAGIDHMNMFCKMNCVKSLSL